MDTYTNCLDCPFHTVINDRDPHDWFCDDDAAVLCTKTKNDKQAMDSLYKSDHSEYKPVATSCRPYNLRKESETPKWCPLIKQAAKA